jgi:iron complex transport system permease protein
LNKTILYFVSLLVLLLIVLLTGLRVGSMESGFRQVLEALFHYDPSNQLHFAIVHLRLPRLILALVVGGSLAFSGYLMQAMVNNALADPYLLGTASGASLGAVLTFFWLPNLTIAGIYLPPVAALAGAFVVTVVVVVLGYRKGQLLPSQLLLAGIAISSLAAAMVALLTFLSDSEGKLRSVVFWTMGGFDKASWEYLAYPALALAGALVLFSFIQKQLHVLLLGPDRAKTLGVNVVQVRWIILVSVSLLTGFAVALSGPVGFVGLIIPHVTRSMLGITGKNNLLFCALAGGVFMVLCDLLSRLLYPPAGLPIGIITSFFGVPFFVYLLVNKSYRFQ